MTTGPAYLTPALRRWQARSQVPLLVVAIGSLPLLLLELQRNELPYGDRLFLDVVNVVVLAAFTVDFVVGLTRTNQRLAYTRASWPNVLIITAQAMALVPGLGAFGIARVLRGGPAIRAALTIGRLVAVGGMAGRGARQAARRNAGWFGLGLAGLTWLTSAAAFTLAEDVGTRGTYESFFDALWWSAATITTVGYGDIYPVTGVGRLIGGVTMVVGISTFALVTAKIAEWLVRGEDDANA